MVAQNSYLLVHVATPKCTSSQMAGEAYRVGFADNTLLWGTKYQYKCII